MKYLNPFFKLVVLVLAFPIVLLVFFEGLCIIFTDIIPGILRKHASSQQN
jgi:hypothetical protein